MKEFWIIENTYSSGYWCEETSSWRAKQFATMFSRTDALTKKDLLFKQVNCRIVFLCIDDIYSSRCRRNV